jgi:hypothetical protein
MATKAKTGNGRRKQAKKVPPELVEEDGQFYIVSGTKRLDVGRNERYAKKMLEDLK